MTNQKCARCDIAEEKARLFDVIYEGKMDLLCERCSIIEGIPIIKKPDTGQLKKVEKRGDVYERMKVISGYKDAETRENSRRERLKELEKNPRLELPIKEQLNLIEHFHWEIMKNRRRKGMSQKQLAESIGESEIAIDMLEKGKIPENPESLIKKLEQFFQVSLRKISEADMMIMRKQKLVRTKPVLLDEEGNELERIPEPEREMGEESGLYLDTEAKETKPDAKETPWYKKILGKKKNKPEESLVEEPQIFQEEKIAEEPMPIGSRYLEYRRRELNSKNPNKSKESEPSLVLKEGEDLDFKMVDPSRVRISDLKEIHKKRVDATKQEKKDEQKKIEERERLIEARKEELRLMKEKQSKNIDEVLGGKELFEK